MSDSAVLGQLPEWDLTDLYPAPDAPELTRDLDAAEADARKFAEAYRGRLAEIDGAALGAAVAEYERIEEVLGRVSSYAQLVYSGNVGDPKIGRFYQAMVERVNAVGTHLIFFTLELNRVEDAILDAQLKAPELARYAPWLRDVRAFRAHDLAEDMERMLYERSVAGRSAWVRLFDQTIAGLRFPFRGKDLTETEVLNLMSDPDGTKRKDAAESVSKVFNANVSTFALITNTLAKDKEVDDRWRGYARPISYRNLSNYVEDPVVDALVSAVRDAYPRLSHRYYALKAKWFGVDALDYWDRNAPPPDQDDRTVPWDEARETVLGAYGDFSPDLANLGKRFFDNAWIDAPARAGKASGAFAHPTVPSAHPYLLLNYQGKVRDVMTLAHELGHGVHQVLAGGQGQLMSGTPLTLAETASVFGEMLTFQAMLRATTDPVRRRAMLASKIEDMINTVVRQIAFCQFEIQLHDQRRKGELTPDEIADIWMGVQAESLGPALRLHDSYRVFWAYIPHFIHSPFYVYAYAFGDCLVNSLYAVYQDAQGGFAAKYLDMLRAGGSKRHQELLAPFGLNAADPAFWNRGLGVLEGLIDELDAAL